MDARAQNAQRSLQLAGKQEKAVRELAQKGYYPQLRLLAVQRDVAAARSEYEQAVQVLEAAKAAGEQTRARLAQAESTARGKWLAELNAQRADYERTGHQLGSLRLTLDNLELRAPEAGIVEQIMLSNADQALGAGQPLMHIVPDDEALLVDVRVENRDIAHVRPGQDATLKFAAFDYQRFGSLPGTVTHVPQDGITDEKTGLTYFNVTIKPARHYLGAQDQARMRLRSGMAAEAELHIGQRSVLSYFINTLLRVRDEAFREY